MKRLFELLLGIKVLKSFDWSNHEKIISFDNSTDEILIAEEQLMQIIQSVNPAQRPRKIKIVSQEEVWKR